MKTTLTFSTTLTVLVGAALSFGGCAQEPGSPKRPPAAKNSAEPESAAAADQVASPAPSTASIDQALTAYEQVRSKLAKDEVATVVEGAAELPHTASAAA